MSDRPVSWFRPAGDLNLEVKRVNRLRVAASFLAAPLLLWLVVLTAQPRLAPWTLRSVGIFCVMLGIGVRLWALSCIEGRKKRVLVTWGPYRHVRHPLYCGSLLLGIGTCVFAGAPVAGLFTGAVYLALYLPSARAEERFLALRFGPEWNDYRARVRAFVPRFPSPPASAEPRLAARWPIRESIEMFSIGSAAIVAGEWLRRFQLDNELSGWWF